MKWGLTMLFSCHVKNFSGWVGDERWQYFLFYLCDWLFLHVPDRQWQETRRTTTRTHQSRSRGKSTSTSASTRSTTAPSWSRSACRNEWTNRGNVESAQDNVFSVRTCPSGCSGRCYCAPLPHIIFYQKFPTSSWVSHRTDSCVLQNMPKRVSWILEPKEQQQQRSHVMSLQSCHCSQNAIIQMSSSCCSFRKQEAPGAPALRGKDEEQSWCLTIWSVDGVFEAHNNYNN